VPRKTPDLVALILAVVVAIVVIATAAAMLYIQIIHPDQDIAYAAETISRLISVLVAALVGYMAGRATKNGT
jgi:hypothetical protein